MIEQELIRVDAIIYKGVCTANEENITFGTVQTQKELISFDRPNFLAFSRFLSSLKISLKKAFLKSIPYPAISTNGLLNPKYC